LKDNPTLNYQLKQVAGDCLDEKQCKKCAVNVVRYMKAVASDEERQRQVDLKKKREEQAKRDAVERQREIELREIKKNERERRREANGQRKNEPDVDKEEQEGLERLARERAEHDAKFAKKRQQNWRRIRILLFISLLMLVLFNVFFISFCDKNNRSSLFQSDFFKQEGLVSTLDHIEHDACPRYYIFNEKSGINSAKRFVVSRIADLSKLISSLSK
jgi:hypothetical protein